ncbi:MAG: Zn-dependent hydrolase [Hyphomicrobiales bacterium]|nr:Zn-dependent hydrolase [Hyphomicrobiales bacterium]
MSTMTPRIDRDRLLASIATFNRIGALPGGGNCRLALSDADREGRDLLVARMRERGLAVTIDAIGNIIGVRRGREDTAPVMLGSHIDTVGTGGRYDGLYGVLAGLEVCAALDDARAQTRRPLALVAFTNEEGARFAPYAMGSLVYTGGLALDDAYSVTGIDGATVGDELRRIGYAGAAPPGWLVPHAYLELHIEQGPVLESAGCVIGAVEGITGLSWTEVTIDGRAGHAGTTPIALRRDAALAAAEIVLFIRGLARETRGALRGTVGRIALTPNLINVIAERAVLTVDLRNLDIEQLAESERALTGFFEQLAARDNIRITTRSLGRFAPVRFPEHMVAMVETTARELGLSCQRLPSGAGHDAQIMARLCPSVMIFVPSIGGLSHNVHEDTAPADLAAGAEVLLGAAVRAAD